MRYSAVPRTALLLGLAAILQGQTPAIEHFETKIRPVLVAQCYACHSGDKPQAGLRLDTSAGIRKGGNSGPLVDTSAPERSILLRALSHQEKELKMPPGKPLAPELIGEFQVWAKAGAPVPEDRQAAAQRQQQQQFWSFRTPKSQSPPAPTNITWARNDIDRFIQAKLEEKQLEPSPEADKRTLIRRVSYDLTGLPPTAAEVTTFVNDKSESAYERLIDRLLASKHYGERWARHWLDVARYSDARTPGDRFAWSYTYRDWVIDALNNDLPYDQFIIQQLAADKVPNNDKRNLAALGFISLGREFVKLFPETVDDRIDATTRGLMGLTVACARCHDHKYDPIPTTDYYSLYSVFANIREPEDLPVIATGAAPADKLKRYEARLAKIRQTDREYRVKRHAEMLSFFETQVPEYIAAAKDAANLSNTAIEDLVRDRQLNLYVLNRWRDYLRRNTSINADQKPAILQDPNGPLKIPVSHFELIYTEGDGNNTRAIQNQYHSTLAMYAYDGAAPRAMAVEEVPDPKPAHVFLRGNPNNAGVETPARFITCLSSGTPEPFNNGSGRLELAKAIASRDNPLTARVIVNRIWMHHFGQGLVRTPSDFGLRGDAPTHPELLDHLAVTLMNNGWSLKKLHKSILLSSTYRQSSADRPEARKLDPENQLLWRMNRRRLDFEALRDGMLSVSGTLDRTYGGVPFSLTTLPSVPRRTVYGYVERGKIPGMLSLFDFPSPDQHAPMRYTTTVPQQALFLLNSPFVAEQAQHVVAHSKAADQASTIHRLYEGIFGRQPTEQERTAGLAFVSQPAAVAKRVAEAYPWQYGTLGSSTFQPFRYFTGDTWQGASMLPSPSTGSARLRANGGEPGTTNVVRRWTSPIDGRIAIEGTVRHNQRTPAIGDGVRARIVTSRDGELASWTVDGRTAETRITNIEVKKGDTIDFIVDGRNDPESDDFSWAPKITSEDKKSWSATADFRGPQPDRLNAWEQYARVLLQTNEFAFVD